MFEVLLTGTNLYIDRLKLNLFGHNDIADKPADLLLKNKYVIKKYTPIRIKVSDRIFTSHKKFYVTIEDDQLMIDFDKKFPNVYPYITNVIYLKRK